MFKVLYKEWLSDEATDRMMPRNSLLFICKGVQKSWWETSILEM